MKNILKWEELAMCVISAWGLYSLNAPWWCYLLLLAGPDISMLGYLAGNRTGAASYNLFHHKAVAVVLFAGGLTVSQPGLQIAGLILFGHASLDRIFGYGLKFTDGFKHTHLGMIGNKDF